MIDQNAIKSKGYFSRITNQTCSILKLPKINYAKEIRLTKNITLCLFGNERM